LTAAENLLVEKNRRSPYRTYICSHGYAEGLVSGRIASGMFPPLFRVAAGGLSGHAVALGRSRSAMGPAVGRFV